MTNTTISKSQLQHDYDTLPSLAEVAKKYGRTQATIIRWMKKEGLKMRGKGKMTERAKKRGKSIVFVD